MTEEFQSLFYFALEDPMKVLILIARGGARIHVNADLAIETPNIIKRMLSSGCSEPQNPKARKLEWSTFFPRF